MRAKLVAIALAIGAVGSSTAAYAAHSSDQQSAACAPVKSASTAHFRQVEQTHKAWVQALARFGQADRRVLAAAVTKDEAEGAEMRYIVVHRSCFSTADVDNAQKWAALDAAAVRRDRGQTAG
jgi:hypothetical protein